MQLKNLYYYFSEALSPEICDRIINEGENNLQKLKSAGVNTSGTTAGSKEKQAIKDKNAISQEDKTTSEVKDKNVYVRDCEVSWINETWLYDIIWPFVREANEKAGWKYDLDWSESCQFTKYHSPGGFYGWHSDSGSDHFATYKKAIPGITPEKSDGKYVDSLYTPFDNLFGKIRKLSVTINLNNPEDYEGGNLKFDYGPHVNVKNQFHECVEIRPRGSIIVFPSHVYHQVTPVTKGTRYSLVMWTLGRPFK